MAEGDSLLLFRRNGSGLIGTATPRWRPDLRLIKPALPRFAVTPLGRILYKRYCPSVGGFLIRPSGGYPVVKCMQPT